MLCASFVDAVVVVAVVPPKRGDVIRIVLLFVLIDIVIVVFRFRLGGVIVDRRMVIVFTFRVVIGRVEVVQVGGNGDSSPEGLEDVCRSDASECEHHISKATSKGTCTSHITMNERLTVADTEPERALKTTAAVGMMRWSFILMFTFISDENYDKQPQPKKHKTSSSTT